jgi:hypothetical protein
MLHCYKKHLWLATNSFQKGINTKSLIAIQASKPGGLMAVESHPNKKSNAIFATLEEANADAVGLAKARCFGKLNWKEGKDPTDVTLTMSRGDSEVSE